MLGAVLYGHQEMQAVIQAINELAAEAGKPRWEWEASGVDEELLAAVESRVKADLGEAYRIIEKSSRYERVGEIRQACVDALAAEDGPSADEVKDVFKSVEKGLVRKRILSGEARIDGRDNRTVRSIACEVDVLPKAHGSALFTRGET